MRSFRSRLLLCALLLACLTRAQFQHTCKGLDETLAHCTSCNEQLGYTSDGKGGCHLRKNENCPVMNKEGECEQCTASTKPVGGQCIVQKKDTECLQFNEDKLCERCPPNQMPNPLRQPFDAQDAPDDCVPADQTAAPNCLLFGERGVCLGCAPGYYLQNDQC